MVVETGFPNQSPALGAEIKQEKGESCDGQPGTWKIYRAINQQVKMTELFSDKTREWECVRKKTGPLNLLDLPVDILRLIVKEACQNFTLI